MGGFSIVHWVVVLAIIGIPAAVFVWLRNTAARQRQAQSGLLVGIAGWLALLAIGQTLMGPRLLLSAAQSLEQLPALQQVQNGPAVVYTEAAFKVGMTVFAAVVAWNLFKRRPRFPGMFTLQWALLLVFAIAEPAYIAGMTGLSASNIYDASMADIVGILVQGVWVAYVWRSRRVANTYGRVGDAADIPATFS